MLPRKLFSEEHELYRDQVRRFIEREITPHHAKWEKDKVVPRSVWLAAGHAGLLCPSISAEYGGCGGDRLHSTVVIEELARAGATGPGFALHSDIVAPYIFAYGAEEQRQRYLPAMARGEIIGAIAMSEPGAGSDLQCVRTTAMTARQWLCSQRLEDLHYQRPERRPRYCRREDRSGPRRERHHSLPCGWRPSWLLQGPQSGKAWDARAGHV